MIHINLQTLTTVLYVTCIKRNYLHHTHMSQRVRTHVVFFVALPRIQRSWRIIAMRSLWADDGVLEHTSMYFSWHHGHFFGPTHFFSKRPQSSKQQGNAVRQCCSALQAAIMYVYYVWESLLYDMTCVPLYQHVANAPLCSAAVGSIMPLCIQSAQLYTWKHARWSKLRFIAIRPLKLRQLAKLAAPLQSTRPYLC